MTNLEKYKGVFIDVFNVSEDVINGEFTKDNVDGWDSIKQLALSSSLEEEFDLLFDAEDIIGLTSFQAGIEILRGNDVEI